MTETPHQQSVPDERQPTEQDQQNQQHAQAGLDRQNLRNYERLTRSVDDRKVAGVAGGLGRHLNMDPTILRVLFVVLCFFGGAGFLLYGAAWLLVPEDGRTQGTIASSPSTRNGLLIAAGVVAALLLIGDSWGGIGFPWPVLLVGIGVLLYLLVKDRGAPQPTETTAASAAAAPPVPPWAPTPVGATAPVPAYQPRPRPDRGPKLFGFTLAVIAIALGALGLYEAAGGDVLDAAYPALALTIVGLMLVVGACVGRAGGLILLGLVSTVALLATSVAGTFGSTDGDRLTATPVSSADVKPRYQLDSGRMVVDLSGVTDPQALDGRVIHLDAGAAEIRLTLPPGVRSEVVADIDGPGQVELPGRSSGGIDTHLEGTYGEGTATVVFDTQLSIGHIDVRNP
jgi:phage shock protein PspC (stress-responsive transcriptional regulator)